MSHDEIIGHLPRHILEQRDLLAQGYTTPARQPLWDTLTGALRFSRRGPLERDPSQKQLIPYVVITREEQVFVMERMPRGAEERLHGKLSCGVGGHLLRADQRDEELVIAGMLRELHEEVSITPAPSHAPVYRGLINDDSDEVGRVHLGVVFHLKVRHHTQVHVLETHKLKGSWWEREALKGERERLESWSRLLLGELAGWC